MSLLENQHYRDYMRRFAAGDFSGSRDCLQSALRNCPENSDRVKIYLAMASTYIDAGNIDVPAIEECFDLAEKIDDTHYCDLARARFYGNVLNDRSRYAAALLKAKQNILAFPDNDDPDGDAHLCIQIDEEIASAENDLEGRP